MQLLELSAHRFRAEGVDEQAFAKYYQEEHIPRMIQIIQKHGITKYTPECLWPSGDVWFISFMHALA